MWWVYIISIVIILYASSVQGTEEVMPSQVFSWSDDSVDKMTQEIAELKTSIETLKVRLEMQQLSYEKQFLKMESIISEAKNSTCSQAYQVMQKIIEPILMKLDSLANANNNPDDNCLSRKNDSLNGSHHNNDLKPEIFYNCAEALMKTQQNGVYMIKLRNREKPFAVYCDAKIFNGNWTVIQRRQDGSVDFYRNWTEYQNGFGDLSGEFFIGLDKLYALTVEYPQELLIELEDFENQIRFAKYDAFAIGGDTEDYELKVLGSYSGNAGDSLSYHKRNKFSTKDRDNDKWSSKNCAVIARGAWWFNDCHDSNLNGVYLRGKHDRNEQGIEWYHCKGSKYSYRRVQMLIRPKSF